MALAGALPSLAKSVAEQALDAAAIVLAIGPLWSPNRELAPDRFFLYATREEAADALKQLLRTEDLVLIKGSHATGLYDRFLPLLMNS